MALNVDATREHRLEEVQRKHASDSRSIEAQQQQERDEHDRKLSEASARSSALEQTVIKLNREAALSATQSHDREALLKQQIDTLSSMLERQRDDAVTL